MRTFLIETWGCQMNLHDSERLEGRLRHIGLEPSGSETTADVILLNTCSVREKPVQKIVSRIGVLEKLDPVPLIGVCGCVAQQEGEALLKRSRAVGFVLGPSQIGRVGEAVRAAAAGDRKVYTSFDEADEYGFSTIFRKSSTRGMVTVIEGCDEFCTFCVVPYTRGREQSRPRDEVLAEVGSMVSTGLQEVELLGQTINAYRCPESGDDFADLLAAVARIKGVRRLRFITSHPRHFNDKLIKVLADYPSVSRYLHLPVQAGSDPILKKMHRRYTCEEYLDLIARIRCAVPDINLSTDVIVGFPGESEEDFQRSLDLLESVRFGQVFAFAYSPRPRTPAARYGGEVTEEDKMARLHRLFELTNRISRELNADLVGRTVAVLIDGDSKRSPDDWQGRGEDNRVVNFRKTGTASVGDIVEVEITAAKAHSLYGELRRAPVRLPTVG